MDKREIETLLEQLMSKESEPFAIPASEDWMFLQQKFQTSFPQDFIDFIELMAIFAFPGEILNVVRSGKANGNDTIAMIYDAEMEAGSWDGDCVPFYRIGNGDYFCLSAKSGKQTAVNYYYHEDGRIEEYSTSFESWIKNLKSFLG